MAGTWYRQSTVSVTNGSAIVTGTGTLFVSQVQVGDMFTVDSSRFYEVQSIDSDLQLTLTENYAGTTDPASVYAIVRLFANSLNAVLANKISELMQKWMVREEEEINWFSGTANGGPNSDGYYPITDWNGNTTLVQSAAAILDSITVDTGAAEAAATAAAASAAAALVSENNAATSETNAATSETNAGISETNAATSESNAATSETNASNWEAKSEKWAEELEDIEVEPGLYSAHHWAIKAAALVAGGAGSAIDDADTDTYVRTEAAADEDKVRIGTGGTERAVIDSTGANFTVPVKVNGVAIGNDHGAFIGLGDDDHTQYHNDARGDARYYTKTLMDLELLEKVDSNDIGAVDGVAGLGSDQRVPLINVPTIAVIDGGTWE